MGSGIKWRMFWSVLLYLTLSAIHLKAQGGEEFNGPFASWADVKQRFGAKGNGVDDDTKALQRAMDEIGPNLKGNPGKGLFTVLYLPAGTYCISSTLILRGKIAVSIIGEDPGRTVLKWIGADNDTMLWANGSAYFKISRIGWDPGGRTGVEAIGVHWRNMWRDANSQSFATLNIEISDNWFHSGFRFGIGGGTTSADGTSANDSELSIRRCIFRNCTLAGISIKGHNALDYWIWDCRFLQCATGVDCSMGNYHLYRCFFSGSLVSDVHNNNGYYNSIRGCYSTHSNDVSSDEGGSSNPFKRIFQDNVVIAPRHVAIRHNHLGKLTLLGNRFAAPTDPGEKYSVYNRSWFHGIYEALSVDNVYPFADAVKLDADPHKVYAVGDRIEQVAEDSLAFLKDMEVMPPFVRRTVFEVPENADAVTIQGILDQAAAMKGQRPVVHFGPWGYFIDRTLRISRGADMQLTGDTWLYGTMIQQKDTMSFRQAPLLRVEGPSSVAIRDMQWGSVWAPHQYAAVVFANVDQAGSEAHIDQLYSPGADTSLFVQGMNYLYVQKDNSFFTTGNYIDGGKLADKGKGTARVACFGGQFAKVMVRHNGRFTAKDCWWEGGERVPLDLEGAGAITIDGGMIAPAKADSQTTVRINKFNGSISLMNMYLQGAITPAADNPHLRLLVWNVHSYYKTDPLDVLKGGASYKAAFLGLTAQCFRSQDPACKTMICIEDRFQNVGQVDGFLEEQTRQTRETKPVHYRDLQMGVTNVYISRVSLGRAGRGLVFLAAK